MHQQKKYVKKDNDKQLAKSCNLHNYCTKILRIRENWLHYIYQNSYNRILNALCQSNRLHGFRTMKKKDWKLQSTLARSLILFLFVKNWHKNSKIKLLVIWQRFETYKYLLYLEQRLEHLFASSIKINNFIRYKVVKA